MIQLTAILIAIALLFVAASVQVKRRLPRVAGWFRRNPMLGCALGILLASGLAWAADTKISALSATTDFVCSKRFATTNVINTSNEYWTVCQSGGLTRRTITGANTVVASDRAKVIEITSGTFTLSFTAAATLADGFWFRVYNSGTGTVTLDPSGAETLDGQTTITLQRGVGRVIYTDGTSFFTAGTSWELVDTQTFTATGAGTWTKHAWARECQVDVIAAGGGGGGGRGNAAGAIRQGGTGGGGGARIREWFLAADLAATESLTVGVGGTAGTGGVGADGTNGGVGGNSAFGTSGSTAKLVAYGGHGGNLGSTGTTRRGGTGGGTIGAGFVGGTANSVGGDPVDDGIAASQNGGWGGASAAVNVAGRESMWGGASGGGANSTGVAGLAGGLSYYAGGGGGAGGGLTAANANSNGGAGGYAGARTDDTDSGNGGTAGTGGAASTAGGAGAAGDNIKSGAGGGGGGSDSDSTGAAGGAGGAPGGGGGGGGGGTNTGGAGGAGGRGEIRVWCFGLLEELWSRDAPVQFAANDDRQVWRREAA